MLTVPEAAKRVGRNPETVRRWIRAGKLTAWKVGTQHMIHEDDLTAAMRGVFAGSVPDRNADQVVGVRRNVSVRQQRRTEPGHQLREVATPYFTTDSDRPAIIGDPWLPAIVGRIVRLVDPVRIILFGSRARGDSREDSDYDVLVVLDEIEDRRVTRIRIRAAIDDLPIAKDVIVATSGQVAGTDGRPRGVLHWALAEGRVLYERV